MNQKMSWTLLVGGVSVWCYALAEVLARHSTWHEFTTPAGVGELLVASGAAIAAVAGAWGITPTKKDKEGR